MADWIEATMLVERRTKLPQVEIQRRLSELESGDVGDAEVEMGIREVKRRTALNLQYYPFAVEENVVKQFLSDDPGPYHFLLMLCMSEGFRESVESNVKGVVRRQPEIDETLDNLAVVCLDGLFGGKGTGVRFGSPASGDRPDHLRQALEWLAGRLGLKEGPHLGDQGAAGDQGVDVIVWRPFTDGRTGFIVAFCQCTVSKHWHVRKPEDVKLDVWRDLIAFGRNPITCVATPYVVPAQWPRWENVRRRIDLPLDRFRMIELLENAELPDCLATEIARWTAEEAARNTER